MRFPELYETGRPAISFEIVPPRTARSLAEMEGWLPQLIAPCPAIVTVAYGAMGGSREHTLETASRIQNEYGMETAHHLTCVGFSRDGIGLVLEDIRKRHISNIVALRGDPPQGQTKFRWPRDGYSHGSQLVEHIRRFGGFGIAVAGYSEKHSEAPDLETDLRNLKHKVDSGADVVISQLFFDNRIFYDFVERCRATGIHQPIIPGLLPILSVEQLKRFAGMCGAAIPDELLRQMEDAGDDQERVHEIGMMHTVNQALDLLRQGVEGIHFYVPNLRFPMGEIMERIKPAL